MSDAKLTASRKVQEGLILGLIAKLFRPTWKKEALATAMDGLRSLAGTAIVITIQDGVKNKSLAFTGLHTLTNIKLMSSKNDNKVCIKTMKPQYLVYLINVSYGYIQRSLKFF